MRGTGTKKKEIGTPIWKGGWHETDTLWVSRYFRGRIVNICYALNGVRKRNRTEGIEICKSFSIHGRIPKDHAMDG
jgi:hypothetical protein